MAGSSTHFTVLGMVRQRPSVHGYGLVIEIARWQSRVALPSRAVYKALNSLNAAQLIEPLDAAADQKAVHYVATPEGDRQFVEWLRSPPETFADLFRRIAAARPDDLPALRDVVIDAEHQLLAQQRDLRVPEVETLVARNAPWETITAAFMQAAEWAEIASRATFLRDLRRALEHLIEHRDEISYP